MRRPWPLSAKGTGSPSRKCSGPGPAARPAPTATSTSCTTLRPGRKLGWEKEQLADELAANLGQHVDLLSLRAVNPRLKTAVLAEARPLMQRDLLLLAEMIDAIEQLRDDQIRSDALL